MTSALSHRPVGPLVSLARFERATYAIEGQKFISCKCLYMADLRHLGPLTPLGSFRHKAVVDKPKENQPKVVLVEKN